MVNRPVLKWMGIIPFALLVTVPLMILNGRITAQQEVKLIFIAIALLGIQISCSLYHTRLVKRENRREHKEWMARMEAEQKAWADTWRRRGMDQ